MYLFLKIDFLCLKSKHNIDRQTDHSFETTNWLCVVKALVPFAARFENPTGPNISLTPLWNFMYFFYLFNKSIFVGVVVY